MKQPRESRPPDSQDLARALWCSVVSAYELAPHEVAILRQVCAVADLIDRIGAELCMGSGTYVRQPGWGLQAEHPIDRVPVDSLVRLIR